VLLKPYGSDSVLMLREVWELVARRDNPAYTPLLLYRMVGGFVQPCQVSAVVIRPCCDALVAFSCVHSTHDFRVVYGQNPYGSDSVLMLREVWELVARRGYPAYNPLLLYRMVGAVCVLIGCDLCRML
jgi:hypothetical protein